MKNLKFVVVAWVGISALAGCGGGPHDGSITSVNRVTAGDCSIDSLRALVLTDGIGPFVGAQYSPLHYVDWSTPNCTTVELNGTRYLPNSSTYYIPGVETVKGTVVYTLTATGTNGTVTKTITAYYPVVTTSVTPLSPNPVTAQQGATNVTLAQFDFTESPVDGTITFDNTKFDIQTTNCSTTVGNFLNNVQVVMDNGTKLTSVPGILTCDGSASSQLALSVNPMPYKANEIKKVFVTGDISPSTPAGLKFQLVLHSTQVTWQTSFRLFTVVGAPESNPIIIAIPNKAPTVNAGADQNIPTLSTTLFGMVSDDKLPANSTLTTNWSVVSGPGTVTFGSVNSEISSASFSAPGVYVLRLTASDGALTSSDDLTITVTLPTNPSCNLNAVSISVPASLPYANIDKINADVTIGNCSSVILVNSGNYTRGYVPSNGSNLLDSGYGPGVATTDSSLHVTLFAGDGANVKSITKEISITNLPAREATNQCAISNLTSITNPSDRSKKTISWSAPADCIVFITRSDPHLHPTYVFNTGPLYFPNTGSVEVSITQPHTFYVTAQGGYDTITVLWAKTLDVAY